MMGSRALTQLKVMSIFVLVEIYLDGIHHVLSEMNSIGEPVGWVLMCAKYPRARDGHHFRVKKKRYIRKGLWFPIELFEISMEKSRWKFSGSSILQLSHWLKITIHLIILIVHEFQTSSQVCLLVTWSGPLV